MSSGHLQLPSTFTPSLTGDEEFVTDGDLLIELVRVAWKSPENPEGLVLDEWQTWLIRHLLERYPKDWPDQGLAGRLRWRSSVVSVGRQNGKSLLGAILAIYGLLIHEQGAQVLSLASSTDQARIIYARVLYVIQNNKALRKRFKKATEHRGITTIDGGSRYDVKAAKEAALQGIPISLCLFDELHLAKAGMWSAAILGTSQRRDGLVIGITTAGDQNSDTLIRLYEEGRSASESDDPNNRFGFFLWEAPANAPVTEPAAIMAANPSVASGRIPVERVISDLKTIPEHEARRYRLNQFISGSVTSWLPNHLFRQAAAKGVTNRTGVVIGVDRTTNWEFATIAAANNNGELIETELIASIGKPTEDKLFNYLLDLYHRTQYRAIVLDDRQFPNLGFKLKQAGLPVWRLYYKEIAGACSTSYAAFSNGLVRHNNDPILVTQMPNGVTKYTGETWAISRKESGEIDALMATLFAMYVALVAKDTGVQVF